MCKKNERPLSGLPSPRYFQQCLNVLKKTNIGEIEIVLPSGDRHLIGKVSGISKAIIQIQNPELFSRIIREGNLGFAEAYLEGWWTAPELQSVMDAISLGGGGVLRSFLGLKIIRIYERIHHTLKSNSVVQARKNISAHYDLGNEFYAKWLDKTMTYSSAIFESCQEDLARAQLRKYASMVDQMEVKSGDHVLEIGCGWGGFAEYAAKERGLRVTGLTISQEQHDFAVARIKAAGLSDKVEIVMRDYRDEAGVYDGIASIEMFEAVGEKYWPAYFTAVRDRLKPGARATLQIITISEKRFDTYRKGVDFIQKHIFPGGMLPSRTALFEQIRIAGLEKVTSIEFGDSYSQTLRRWRELFNGKWREIKVLGFDDRFYRMWNYYLTSCAAAFQSGNCDVTQVTVSRPD